MRFCRKKALLTLLLASILSLPLMAWKLGETINVQTLDGHFFPNAELMSVNDGGITICYNNKQNEPVLKGLTFDKLPVDLRLRYGYDPDKFAVYQKGVGTYRPPAEPAPQPKEQTPPAKNEAAKSDDDKDKDKDDDNTVDDTPSLISEPWDWYYTRTKYVIPRYPPPPHKPHKPGPHKPGPHKPGPHKPGPHKPAPNPSYKPAPSKPAPAPRPVHPGRRPMR